MRTAALLILPLVLFALPAQGGEARASGNVPVHTGPGSGYAVIGNLADGAYYDVVLCTPRATWCRVAAAGDALGWVAGSYLVGSGAKAAVTPLEFLSSPEFVPN